MYTFQAPITLCAQNIFTILGFRTLTKRIYIYLQQLPMNVVKKFISNRKVDKNKRAHKGIRKGRLQLGDREIVSKIKNCDIKTRRSLF